MNLYLHKLGVNRRILPKFRQDSAHFEHRFSNEICSVV